MPDKLAERLQDTRMMFDYYHRVTRAIIESADQELMFIYLPKMVRVLDKLDEPDDYDHLTVLMRYEWLIYQALAYPQISFERIKELCDDFESRLSELNENPRAILLIRSDVEATRMNDERAFELAKAAQDLESGYLEKCPLCVDINHLYRLSNAGHVDEALKGFERVLEQGRRCGDYPSSSYAHFGHLMLKQSRIERGDELYRRGWELMRDAPNKNTTVIDKHIAYFAYKREWALVKRELPARISYMWIKLKRPIGRMYSCATLAYTLSTLLSSGETHLEVARFDEAQLSWDDRGLSVKHARDLFAQEALRIAELFDQRNGHSRQSEAIETLINSGGFK